MAMFTAAHRAATVSTLSGRRDDGTADRLALAMTNPFVSTA
jgi:hypothetical protein